MTKIHMAGKMGDLVLALPAIRAYARMHGPIDLITSALCVPMVPLLWECSYINSVEVDSSKAYELDGKICLQWEYFKYGEGINLSPQPAFREQSDYSSVPPYHYSDCYMQVLGISRPDPYDYMIFPSLVNHRRWFESHDVFIDGKIQKKQKTVILAPECESCPSASSSVWKSLVWALQKKDVSVIIIGKKLEYFDWLPHLSLDMRGSTSIPVAARIIAEADALIGAHSFPMQLAARIEVPTVCLQDMVPTLDRANPMRTDVVYIHPDEYQNAVSYVVNLTKTVSV